ncbi:MAG: PPOX class F420-dependent oxidoreductase [Gammaproteobacteria bacterium]|nr:PPOX class F420-dependent oxidoreductase [Gammaproteobacteria bacterium]
MPVNLADARYFNLATFRKSGVAVETPVWFATDGNVHYVFSEGQAGKVKRIRANGRARVAACDVRGRVLGPWQEGRARVITDVSEIARAYRALRARYGWQMMLTDFFSKVTGRFDKRALLAVELDRA